MILCGVPGCINQVDKNSNIITLVNNNSNAITTMSPNIITLVNNNSNVIITISPNIQNPGTFNF